MSRLRCQDVFTCGNTKTGPEVLLFNLPAVVTCTPTEWCRLHCYARTGWHQLPNVKGSQLSKWELSKSSEFVVLAIRALNGSSKTFVRLHASGDFYSEEYVEKWIQIAKSCPDKRFKTTTKRIDLMEAIGRFDSLPNVTVKESLDFTRSKPSGVLQSFMYIDETEGSDKAVRCVWNCQKCNYLCWDKSTSVKVPVIGDYYHRRRKF